MAMVMEQLDIGQELIQADGKKEQTVVNLQKREREKQEKKVLQKEEQEEDIIDDLRLREQ